MKYLLLAITAFIALSFFSCNTTGCLENRSSIPLAQLYSSTTGEAISADSIDIGGVGAPDDSLLVSAGTSVSSVYLPFRSTYTNVAFFFSYKWEGMTPQQNDTIWFEYKPVPYFASEECGAMYRYIITSVRHTSVLLDSVVILDSLVTNIDIASLRLYFPTDETQDEPEL